MTEHKIGDPVLVLCKGLAMLRGFMPSGKPNHHGWVHEFWDDGTIVVEFPIGDDDPNKHSQVAPYSPELVAKRDGKHRSEI